MERCVYINVTKIPDGYGGYTTEYSEGFPFDASITFDNSTNAQIALKEGVTSLYTVTTKKNLVFEYHNIFKRIRDGKYFRVTSDGDDVFSPASSSLNMRQVKAEEFKLYE